MSRHARLGKTMHSEQRRLRRLRNRAYRMWKRERTDFLLEMSVRDGDPLTPEQARVQASVAAELWFGWRRHPAFAAVEDE